MTKHSNSYVHNKDPIAQRRKMRNLKGLLKWGAIGSLGIMAGCGLIKSDLEQSTALAGSYADEYLIPAKEALANGDKEEAERIAKKGYNRFNYSLGPHRHDINVKSKYCRAVLDSLADIAFD